MVFRKQAVVTFSQSLIPCGVPFYSIDPQIFEVGGLLCFSVFIVNRRWCQISLWCSFSSVVVLCNQLRLSAATTERLEIPH